MFNVLSSVVLAHLVISGFAASPPSSISQANSFNGTTTVTYSIGTSLCLGTAAQSFTLNDSLISTSFRDITTNVTSDTQLANELEFLLDASISTPPNNITYPTLFITTDSQIQKPSAPSMTFWNLTVVTGSDGTSVISGLMTNDLSDKYVPGNPTTYNQLLLTLGSPETSAGCTDIKPNESWDFYVAKGAQFTMKAFSNGNVTLDIQNAALWCGNCAGGDKNGTVHQSAGTLSMTFTSTPPKATHNASGPIRSTARYLLGLVAFVCVAVCI